MASGDTTTVRIRCSDAERLQVLAKRRHTAVVDVIHHAIDALERQEFVRGLSDDHRRLQSDPTRWEAFMRERDEWDRLA